ncbi:MFS transporter [Cryptosporangium arvum]|uniref:Arabinose efflux permease family protein n=1 Tax=Cryptosporangium arvum DSM 44712 TaxID=927661 RepID=A0A010YMS8_9ACTN|nr:MFS transporter [Cryptosporangium arvum]EXG81525.1 arabinose efflux permease family protein [Cryptosporangium arvum DSM 44712]
MLRAPADAPATPRFIVPVLASGGLVAAIMQTIVVPLIPSLPTLLDAAPDDASWVLTATLLAGAVATPVAGRMGDMFGKRRMMIVSLGLLVVGAVCSALSGSLALMVVGRVLQGAGAGAIPLGISLMKDILPADRQGSAIAFMSSTMGTGAAIGLPASALVAENADWHLLFWGAGAVGALALVAVVAVVPESGLRAGGRFDVVGAAGLAVWLTGLLLVISKGNTWGWTSPAVVGPAAVAAVVAPLWAMFELRRKAPLVDLRTTVRRPVLVTNCASVLIGFAMYGSVMILPQLLQAPRGTGFGLGQSMLAAGLCMAPSGLVMLFASPLSARLTAARGARTTLLVGATVLGSAFAAASFLMHAVWQIVLIAIVTGLGIALAYAAMPTLIMQNVPVGETAAANGLNTLMRSLGTSMSSAIMAVLLADAFVTTGGGALPTGLGAFRLAYTVAAAAALTGALLCLLLPRERR